MTPTQIWLSVSVALYMLAMLGIGYWTRQKIQDTADYIVAGRRLGWWLSIGTIFATWFGAETCMGSSRTAYEKGFLGVIADPFGAGLCLVLAGLLFAKFFHQRRYETIVDFFEERYGKLLARAMSVLYMPVYLGWVAAQLLAFGIILNTLTGLPYTSSIVISTGVVVLYTYWGGMWAVSVTDLVQMVIIVIGLLILFPIMLGHVGGLDGLRAKVPEDFFHMYPRSNTPLVWLGYLQAWIMVGLGSLPGQDLFQRLVSPRTPRVAQWSSIWAGVLYVLIGLLPVYLGIMGRVALPDGKPDSVLVDLTLKYLPTPLIALMIGALLSAIMSTVSAALLAPAGIIGHNIVPYLKKDASDALQLRWCKWSIPIVGAASLVIALYFQNIYTLCTQSWGILLVGVVAPMFAGVYWKRATTSGAIAGAVAGTASWMVFTLCLPEDYPSNLFGLLVSCVAVGVVSLLTPETAQPSGTAALSGRTPFQTASSNSPSRNG
ncbi:MAG: sodium:solute symporter family protein [Verrucomicrobiae bacterium]|nr:sodium:solute symporter family protein [Verrucomicrobiae bacterium]